MRSRLKRWAGELALMALFTVIVLGIVGYLRAPSFGEGGVPPFAGVTLSGKPFELRPGRQAPLLLHFWGSWCPVCRAEAGNVAAAALGGRVMTVAVRSGSDAEVLSYLQKNGLAFPVINDAQGTIAQAFGITVYPTTILLGRDGEVLWSETGYTTTLGLKLRLWMARHF